jgi:hypothetical protein
MAAAAIGARCDTPSDKPQSTPTQITRERAIEIARQGLSFSPDSVDAVQTTSEAPGRPAVWRVTLKGRLPDQPPGLFETRIFDIDVKSGKIVSASMN